MKYTKGFHRMNFLLKFEYFYSRVGIHTTDFGKVGFIGFFQIALPQGPC